MLWIWLHAVVGFLLLLTGISLKKAYDSIIARENIEIIYKKTLSISLGITSLLFLILRFLHDGIVGKTKKFNLSQMFYNFDFFKWMVLIKIVIAIIHLVVDGTSDNFQNENDSDVDTYFVAQMFVSITANVVEILIMYNNNKDIAESSVKSIEDLQKSYRENESILIGKITIVEIEDEQDINATRPTMADIKEFIESNKIEIINRPTYYESEEYMD